MSGVSEDLRCPRWVVTGGEELERTSSDQCLHQHLPLSSSSSDTAAGEIGQDILLDQSERDGGKVLWGIRRERGLRFWERWESLFLGGGPEMYREGGWDLERLREDTQTFVLACLMLLAGPAVPCPRVTPGGNCNRPATPGLGLVL